MKSKKLLFSSLLGFACLSAYLVLTSSSNGMNGVMGAAQTGTGCGSCHGSTITPATKVRISGIPVGGYVNGNTYSLTVSVENASKVKAGFDLKAAAGTISNAPAGTMLMAGNTEIHHTAPVNMTSGVASWTFDWTAPATGNSVNFKAVGNAVNGNGNDSGDEWNRLDTTFNKQAPTNVYDHQLVSALVYPNPASSFISIQRDPTIQYDQISIISSTGQMIKQLETNQNTVFVGDMAPGMYYLKASTKHHSYLHAFIKQ